MVWKTIAIMSKNVGGIHGERISGAVEFSHMVELREVLCRGLCSFRARILFESGNESLIKHAFTSCLLAKVFGFVMPYAYKKFRPAVVTSNTFVCPGR